MRSDGKWGFLAAAFLTMGLVVAAEGGPAQATPGARATNGTVLAPNYDPYTAGWAACPQGAPYGGPKCQKLLPRTGTHSPIG
ncbi:MAG TPA: hypothetical protein VGG57_22755 [Stellaceae bacterium]|jgi:hypothetical protein